jgi:hypothetical protein
MCKLTRIYVLTYAHRHLGYGGAEIAQCLVASLGQKGRKRPTHGFVPNMNSSCLRLLHNLACARHLEFVGASSIVHIRQTD